MLTVISEKLDSKMKNTKFEIKIAMKKVNQSVVILVFTVIFFTYVATNDIIKYDKELKPKGNPIITSFKSPAKKICPLPSNSGLLETQK